MAAEKKEQKKENEKLLKCPWCGKESKYKTDIIKHEQKCPQRPVAYKGAK